MKVRLDKFLLEHSLAPTRTRAQERITAGQVSVDGIRITRTSFPVDPGQHVEMHGEDIPYVGRGALKLAAALDAWKIDVAGRICLDVGISTGGFSDLMLQRGAKRIVGIDSGHGQLAASLQGHPRLQVLEGVNARYLTSSLLPTGIEFFAVDVSFIAASLVLPAVIASAFPSCNSERHREAVVLVKPQYEAGREFVGKRGVVKDAAAHELAIGRVRETVRTCGARATEVIDSPIAGGEGNREFLLYARF